MPFAVEKLELNYKKADNTSSVSVSGNELAVGANTVTVKVTAANGATKTYTIDVTRQQDPNYKASTDAALSTLTIEGATLSPTFTPTVTDYIAYVPFETRQVTIAAALRMRRHRASPAPARCSCLPRRARRSSPSPAPPRTARPSRLTPSMCCGCPPTPALCPLWRSSTRPPSRRSPAGDPGTLTLPLLGEVRTLYVAIAVAVLLVIVLFLLGFLIGRGAWGALTTTRTTSRRSRSRPRWKRRRTASVLPAGAPAGGKQRSRSPSASKRQ